MKKTNKKGFTIVELVIVIAVIAILAAVMIPTFGNIIEKANESAALQTATAAYKEAQAKALYDGKFTANETATANNFTFTFDANGNVTDVTEPDDFGYTVTVPNGKVAVTKVV